METVISYEVVSCVCKGEKLIGWRQCWKVHILKILAGEESSDHGRFDISEEWPITLKTHTIWRDCL